ncbi:ABC transporter substrate-binding protein [Streptomyces sp. NBC_01506]|uniref:ABC transporter substrate-binding protein n=1 Tax=Streptomyces sp. NBC_01506 TaxID=2903887 RepID=UPI003863F9C7
MKRRVGAVVAVLALSAAVGCSANGATPGAGDTLTISVSVAAPANAPIFLADELGYFEDEGLDVKVQTVANASMQLATGKIQYGAVNTSTVIQAVAQKIGLQQICVTQVDPSYMLAVSDTAWDRNNLTESMSLKEQLAALEGENITAIGGRTVNPGAKLLESLLEKEGLEPDSIGVISQASSAASTAAFQNGQVGLVFQPQPIPDQVLSVSPGRIIYDTGSSPLFAELNGTAWSGIGTSKSYAADHPDISEKVCDAIGRANNYLDTKPEDAAKTLHKDMSAFAVDVLAKSMGSYKWAKDASMSEEKFAESIKVLTNLGMFDAPSAEVVEAAYTAEYQP